MPTAASVLQAYAEREQGCDQHTHEVSVVFNQLRPTWRRVPIVAGFLRVLAESVDGFCAFKGAKDEDLTKDGMVFRFRTEDHIETFITRCERYMEVKILDHLTFTY